MFSLLWTRRLGRFIPSSLASQSVCLFSSSGHVNAYTTEEYRTWFQRKRQDLNWFENQRTRNRKRENEKLARDPEYRQKRFRVQREKYASGDYKARFHLQRKLYSLCISKAWIREQLPWKTYTPIFYPHSIELHCTGCGRARARGSKLFWLNRDNEHHLCNGCYAGKGWTDAMPTGYEDCRSLKDLAARKQQLDGIDPTNLP